MPHFARFLCVAGAFAGLASSAGVAAAQLALEIMGNEIRLGSERHVVLSQLKSLRVQCFGEPNVPISACRSILVQTDGPPYDTHANIFFEGSRVKSVRKYWVRGYEGTDPRRFVQTFYTVVAALARESSTPLQLTVAERRDPGVINQVIFISSGRKTVSVSYTEGLRGADGKVIPPFVNLDEALE